MSSRRRRRRGNRVIPTIVAIVIGFAVASAVYFYQNPDTELKAPEGIVSWFTQQRPALESAPESFAALVATSTPRPNASSREDGQDREKPDFESRVSELERKVHVGINGERAKNGGRPELRWDDRLGAIARAHSEDMTRRGYFSHDTPEGLGPMERIKRAGYECWKETHYGIAENITIELVSGSLDGMARGAVQSWVGSPGHRANLLDRQYNRTGIGASFGKWRGYDAVYLTQVFC